MILDFIMASFSRDSYTVLESDANLTLCLTLLIPDLTERLISIIINSSDGSALGKCGGTECVHQFVVV